MILGAVPHYIVQLWFNQSLGFSTIFWTNLRAQAVLFAASGLLVMLAIWLPVRLHARSRALRSIGLHGGVWAGTIAGWLVAREFQQFLLAAHGIPFGRVDPVFGRDLGFYVYSVPAWRIALLAVEAAAVCGVMASLVARTDELMALGTFRDRSVDFRDKARRYATATLTFFVCALGTAAVGHTWLARYGLLLKNNEATGVRAGAAYVDVTGLFSTLNNFHVALVVESGLTILAGLMLLRLREGRGRSLRTPIVVSLGLLAVELVFTLAVAARDHVFVKPNEPFVQTAYIQRHIDATRAAYRLDNVEVHDWTPTSTPLDAAALQANKTLQNAPFLPGWVSSLEEPPDIQHYRRVAVSKTTLVYGPMLSIFEQQQQLRPYYKFLSVDDVRYVIDGEKRMFVSAARELPSLAFVGPKEWLRYWGSAALMLTHGFGLVMSPANQIDEVGSPLYVAKDVPPSVAHAALEHEPRIYFGEGLKDDYVLTGARGLQEFDYASEQFRTEFSYPADLRDGIPVSSLFRRMVFALYTTDLTSFVFSRYVDESRTRIHINRTPLSRAQAIAPFLFLDSNTFAFVADRKVLWMINGLTTTSEYPYAFREVLGDKSDERAVEEFPERVINYAEDSVKITVDAYSGELRFYKIANDPIVNSWAVIYPDLFRAGTGMPPPVRQQLTYPLQWFHIQFDDIYKRYHQRDAIEFYNVEDLWDDADETLGSIGRGLSGFGTSDEMTFSYEGYSALLDPADLPAGVDIGKPGDLQYTMMMPFTPEGGRNLRSLVMALQDPGQYGRLLSLQIPQGMFVPGPEQIDAYIDNDRPVHQQVTMWIRHAAEVIRGSTLLLPVGGAPLYLETVWASSTQNDLPQIKLFALWYHERITSGMNLEEAVLKRNTPEAVNPPAIAAVAERSMPIRPRAPGVAGR